MVFLEKLGDKEDGRVEFILRVFEYQRERDQRGIGDYEFLRMANNYMRLDDLVSTGEMTRATMEKGQQLPEVGKLLQNYARKTLQYKFGVGIGSAGLGYGLFQSFRFIDQGVVPAFLSLIPWLIYPAVGGLFMGFAAPRIITYKKTLDWLDPKKHDYEWKNAMQHIKDTMQDKPPV